MKLSYSKQYRDSLKYYSKYYKDISTKINNNFQKAVAAGISAIQQNPEFQIRYKSYRCFPLEKYPFMIHFTISNKVILILDLIHTSRNPDEHWIK